MKKYPTFSIDTYHCDEDVETVFDKYSNKKYLIIFQRI